MGKTRSKSAQMAMNCCVDVAEVTWGNNNTLEISRILIETHKLNLMQNQQKTIKTEAIYTCNVNWNRLLFDCLTLKHVSNRFILHQKFFVRLGKPKVTVQVKLAKLASISPRWDKHTPNHPKWTGIPMWTWLRWNGAIVTLWYAWVCKNRWVRGSRWH